ncbi:MAG TPA: hypothetical protein VHY37_02955 [Tepidisphaeraceae bacterium]|jgi:hypothetical protein|nr:hypothetical protein [Tepidisphaeraceae bacterium]
MYRSYCAIQSVNRKKAWIVALAMFAAWQGSQNQARATPLEVPSGTISTVSSGASNTYAVTIQDGATATDPIGTVWFAWVPGNDFLATSPTADTSPTGWTVNAITHGGPSDGYAIQWVASSSTYDIPIGGSLSGFGFATADSSSAIDGDSIFYPGTPVLTTFAYSAGPFSDAGTEFVVTPAPEPTALTAAALPVILLLRRRRSATAIS